MTERERLIELLSRYFQIGDSYAYNLTRVKTAFEVGTMTLDDFEEFDEETVADIADYLIEHCENNATDETARNGTEWISVNKQLPKESTNARDRVLVVVHGVFYAGDIIDTDRIYGGKWVRWGDSVTHWMPLPGGMI